MAQNAQPSAQPACDEMQSVRRPPEGISTDSIASPSASRQRNFRVPSADSCSTSAVSRGSGKRGVQLGPQGQRQLGRLGPGGHRRLPEPPEDLARPVARQPALGHPGGQEVAGGGRGTVQQVDRGLGRGDGVVAHRVGI